MLFEHGVDQAQTAYEPVSLVRVHIHVGHGRLSGNRCLVGSCARVTDAGAAVVSVAPASIRTFVGRLA